MFILGSCVTRDAFEFLESNIFEVECYLARTSLASSFSAIPVTDIDISGIASAFQQKMVLNDLLKSTESTLIQTDFDYLVIDLIDERFNLFRSKENEVFTVSSELKDNVSLNKLGHYISPNDDEFFELWCKGWDKLIAIAKENNFLDKIVVNKVYWTNTSEDGSCLLPDYQGWINKNNKWLDKLYEYIGQVGKVEILDYPSSVFIGDRDHKWGAQPYHYSSSFYLEFLQRLKEINKL